MLKTGFEYKYYLFSLIYTIHIVYLRGTGTNDYNKQFKLI